MVISAYIEKAPVQQTENVQALSSNVQNASDDTETFNNSIPQNEWYVKYYKIITNHYYINKEPCPTTEGRAPIARGSVSKQWL